MSDVAIGPSGDTPGTAAGIAPERFRRAFVAATATARGPTVAAADRHCTSVDRGDEPSPAESG